MNWELGFEIKFNFAKYERWISNEKCNFNNEMCSDEEWEKSNTPGSKHNNQGMNTVYLGLILRLLIWISNCLIHSSVSHTQKWMWVTTNSKATCQKNFSKFFSKILSDV